MSTCTRFCTSTAWALLVSALAQWCSDAVHAQGVLDLREEPLEIQESGAVCLDQTRPPDKRVSTCSRVIRALEHEREEHPVEHPSDAESRKRAAVVDKSLALAFDDRANALKALGKPDEAIADLTRAIAIDPTDLLALSGRSYLYLESGRLSSAIADLNHVISVDPANGMAFYNRGVAHQRSGNPRKALDDYRSAVRLLPSFAPAHVALAALLDADARGRLENPDASQSELSETLRSINRSIASNGSDSVAYLHRGIVNEELGNLQAAMADYSRSLQLAPSAAGYFNRAGVYQRLQEPEQALADFTAALQVDPRYVPALIGRAEENYARGQLPASLEDYSRVIQADPNNATAYFERGNVLSDLQKFAEAFSDYSESLKLKPDQPDVLYNRAVAAERIGRLEAAESDRRRAQELDNSSHE